MSAVHTYTSEQDDLNGGNCGDWCRGTGERALVRRWGSAIPGGGVWAETSAGTELPQCTCRKFCRGRVAGIGAFTPGAGVWVDRGPCFQSLVSGTNVRSVSLAETTHIGPAGVLNQQENPSRGLSRVPCTEQELSPRETSGFSSACAMKSPRHCEKAWVPSPELTADNCGTGWNALLPCSHE